MCVSFVSGLKLLRRSFHLAWILHRKISCIHLSKCSPIQWLKVIRCYKVPDIQACIPETGNRATTLQVSMIDIAGGTTPALTEHRHLGTRTSFWPCKKICCLPPPTFLVCFSGLYIYIYCVYIYIYTWCVGWLHDFLSLDLPSILSMFCKELRTSGVGWLHDFDL